MPHPFPDPLIPTAKKGKEKGERNKAR